MNIKKTISFLAFYILAVSSMASAQIKIILKLDDLVVYKNITGPIPIMDYLVQQKIKVAFGVITTKFDSTSLKTLSPYLSATNSKGEKLFEIWNHGLDHKDPEFKNTSYAYQKEHFDSATNIIKRFLGLEMHSFGAPFNASDTITNRVILEDNRYKIAMFNSYDFKPSTGVVNLTHRVNMETSAGNPDYDFFIKNYTDAKEKYGDYMVLQGHPFQWDAVKMKKFTEIVEFLISEGCEFVLPFEYYQQLNKKSK